MSRLVVTTVEAIEWLVALVACGAALLGVGVGVALERIRRRK